MDDDSGWHDMLVNGWSSRVRDAVAGRVIVGMRRDRGALVRAIRDEDEGGAWTETVHQAIVAAIFQEVGADLNELGSQSAWATYEDVWHEIARRVGHGEGLTAVPAAVTPAATRIVVDLPPSAARAAGAAVDAWEDVHPVVVDGSLRLHVDGLHEWLATDEHAADVDRDRAWALLGLLDPPADG